MSIYAERDCYESDQEWRQAIARECRKEEYLDRLEEEKEDQEEEEITLDEAIEDMINLKENMEVPRAGAIDLAIKALERWRNLQKEVEFLADKHLKEMASIIVGNIPINGDECYSIPEYQQAKAMAIKALEQQPCEDCISRQAVLDINEHHHGQMPNHVNHEIWKEIKALSSVTPKEKTGKWIKYGTPRDGEQHYQCTNCKWYVNFGQWGDVYTKQFKYCPNCGARMIEPKERKEG